MQGSYDALFREDLLLRPEYKKSQTRGTHVEVKQVFPTLRLALVASGGVEMQVSVA